MKEYVRAWRGARRGLGAVKLLLDACVWGGARADLEAAGADTPCLIVGGDERVERFRHPLQVGAPVTRLAMAVVVARRGGLHAAATRMASNGPITAPA